MNRKKVKEGKRELIQDSGFKIQDFQIRLYFPPAFRAGARQKELKVLIIIPVHPSVALAGATFPRRGKELLLVVQIERLVLNKKADG